MNILIPSTNLAKSYDQFKDLCRLCGVEITASQDFQNPCPNCLRNEPKTVLKRFDATDRETLKRELDIDLSAKEVVITEDASIIYGKEWQGYKIEYFGVLVGRFSEFDWETYESNLKNFDYRVPNDQKIINNLIALKHTPHRLMPFNCILIEKNPDLIVMLCRTRIFYEYDALYSEMKFQSFGVGRISIQGLERSKTKKGLERVWKGLDLLRRIDKNFGGRPKGSTELTKREFCKQAVKVYAEYLEENREHPRNKHIAQELRLTEPTFYRYMKKVNWNKKILRNKAEEKVKSNESVFDSF